MKVTKKNTSHSRAAIAAGFMAIAFVVSTMSAGSALAEEVNLRTLAVEDGSGNLVVLWDEHTSGWWAGNQYTPFEYKYPEMKLPEYLNRKLPQGHYDAAADYLLINDQTNAFIQEDASGDELLPDFRS